MLFPRKESLILFGVLCCTFALSVTPIGLVAYDAEPVATYFSPELNPGQNFTWVVNEWYGMKDWLNQETEYVPKMRDLWTMTLKDNPVELPLNPDASWDIMLWHTEEYNFLTFATKFDFNISGYNGNGDLAIRGTVEGHYNNDFSIEFDGYLGIRESFVYKKTPIGAQLPSGVLNITLKESSFKPADTDESDDGGNNKPADLPLIPGYTHLLGVGLIFATTMLFNTNHRWSKKT